MRVSAVFSGRLPVASDQLPVVSLVHRRQWWEGQGVIVAVD